MPQPTYAQFEIYRDALVRAAVVEQAKAGGEPLTPLMRYLDYTLSEFYIWRVVYALEEKYGLDRYFSLIDAIERGLEMEFAAVSRSWHPVDGWHQQQIWTGLAIADRSVLIRQLEKLTKNQIEILFKLQHGDSTSPVATSVRAIMRMLLPHPHRVLLSTTAEDSLEVRLSGSDLHDDLLVFVVKDAPVRFSTAQIKEFGLVLPKDTELTEADTVHAKIVPMLPADKFCRVRSVEKIGDEAAVVTHNLRKADASVTLSANDLRASAWAITIEDRMAKKGDDEQPKLQPVEDSE